MKLKKFLLSLSLVTITSGIILPLTLSNKTYSNSLTNLNKYNYIYNGKQYLSVEGITKEYLIQNKPINSELFIGDINEALFDYNNQMININKLRKFDRSRIQPAYKNAINEYVPSYNEAKKSFVNPGLIQYKYDDLNGKVFDSREEAMESILSSSFKNPIGYYEIKGFDGSIIKINPLNKDDINFYKNFTMQTLFNKQQGLQKTDIEIFDIEKNNSDYQLSNYIDEFLTNNPNNKNSFYAIMQDFKKEAQIVHNKILNQLKWDIQLIIRTFGDSKIVQYQFNELNDIAYKKNEDKNIKLKINKDRITFQNVPYNKLELVNTFANRDAFSRYNGIGLVELWKKGYKIAYEANLKMYGKNFDLKYTGQDRDEAWGFDIDILRRGTYQWEPRGVAFDANIKLQNKSDSLRLVQESLKKLHDDFLNKFSNTVKSEKNKLISFAMKSFINEQYKKFVDNIFNQEIQYGELDQQSSKKFWVNSYLDISKLEFNDSSNELSNVLKREPKLLINVNNHPTFWIKFNDELRDKINSEINTSIDEKDFTNTRIKTKYLTSLLKYWSNLDNIQKNEFVKNNIINVSNNFNKNNIAKINLETNKFLDQKIIKNNDKTLAYNFSDNELSQPSLIPNITMKSMDYKIDMAIDQYNKTIKHYKYLEDSNFDSVDPNDILVLYNENASQKELMYSEFLSNKLNYNPSLFNSRINLYNDEALINNALVNIQKLRPAKVVVLYDLKGNIVNPGIALNEQEELLSTSDVIYDSERNILDNLLRTKVILPDIEKKFYIEKDNSYTLLKNQVDMIYQLDIANNKYYFKSFADARMYLYKYLELKAQKVQVKN